MKTNQYPFRRRQRAFSIIISMLTNKPKHSIGYCALLAGLLSGGSAFGQWTGEGAGGFGTDVNDTANWANATINGSFANNSSNANLSLSADLAVDELNFDWATANDLTISGNGTGVNEVITLNGPITLSRTTGTSNVTLGDDITIDLTNSTNRVINADTTYSGGRSNLYVNSLITGNNTGSGSGDLTINNAGEALDVYFLNDSNDFDIRIASNTDLYFTSIGNVGGGASALGAPTTATTGKIRFNNGLIYIGTADQSSDRTLEMTYTGSISNYSTVSTKLTLTGNVNRRTNELKLNASSGNTLEITGNILDSSEMLRLNNNSGDTGTIRLAGTGNTYTGLTVLYRGDLIVDGDISSSPTVYLYQNSTLSGSGKVGAITGSSSTNNNSGLVAPGNSAGILTATSLNFNNSGSSNGMDFAFEMTQVGEATWSSATGSGNDVLRLTDATTPLINTADNSIFSIYFTSEGTFIGGLYTDLDSDFSSLISSATFKYYILDEEGGTIAYNGVSYSELDSSNVTASVVQVGLANFQSGDVANGWAQQFVVVPEPSTCALGLALGMLAFAAIRRKRG